MRNWRNSSESFCSPKALPSVVTPAVVMTDVQPLPPSQSLLTLPFLCDFDVICLIMSMPCFTMTGECALWLNSGSNAIILGSLDTDTYKLVK